ncbi:MAG TPA: hypothetical protein VGL53_01360 [Bryobacteraceae bacterium]
MLWAADQSDPFRDELASRGKAGLSLATVSRGDTAALHIRRFDGSTKDIALDCCARTIFADWSSGYAVLLNVSFLQMASGSIHSMMEGGEVVVADVAGREVTRSKLKIQSLAVAVDAEAKRFAFLGRPGHSSGLPERAGLYIAGFRDTAARLLIDDVGEPMHPDLNRPSAAIDWSPDGHSLAYSPQEGKIRVVSLPSGSASIIGDGSGAHWSPSGATIAFISPAHRLVLHDVATGSNRVLLPEREMLGAPPLWSPDGRYLLLSERKISVWPRPTYGHLDVYRIADGAILSDSFPFFGIHTPWPSWVMIPQQK